MELVVCHCRRSGASMCWATGLLCLAPLSSYYTLLSSCGRRSAHSRRSSGHRRYKPSIVLFFALHCVSGCGIVLACLFFFCWNRHKVGGDLATDHAPPARLRSHTGRRAMSRLANDKSIQAARAQSRGCTYARTRVPRKGAASAATPTQAKSATERASTRHTPIQTGKRQRGIERTRKKKNRRKRDAPTRSAALWVAVPPSSSRAVRDSDPRAGVLCRRPSRTARACGRVWHAGRARHTGYAGRTGSTGSVGRAGRSGASRAPRRAGSRWASRRDGTRGSAGAATAARGL